MTEGIRLRADQAIIPVIERYEASLGAVVPAADLPCEYGETLKEVPVIVDLLELSRPEGERHYSATMTVKLAGGGMDVRTYSVTHRLQTDEFLFTRAEKPEKK